jgi:hypothetical protein
MDDSLSSLIDRIRAIAADEFPSCSVVFDEAALPMVRFRILNQNGTVLSRECPTFEARKLEVLTQADLRRIIRKRVVCPT